MNLQFSKMHGAGNDFVVIDATRQPFALDPAQLRRLADRHFGVGADQILVVDPAPAPDVDFGYRIFNADGGEVEQCGNGARCFAAFVHRQGLTTKRTIRVSTRGGVIAPRLENDGRVTVDMGAPRFATALLPFIASGLTPQIEGSFERWPLDVNGVTAWVSLVSMGNPHAVQRVDAVDDAPVEAQGPQIEHHARFPARVNAGFMQVLDVGHVRLRVWERGSGETLACGTGACAAVVAGLRRGWLRGPVDVDTRGGRLRVTWDGGAAPVLMTGPAEHVFDATIEI